MNDDRRSMRWATVAFVSFVLVPFQNASAELIDDFNDQDLTEYTQTLIVDTNTTRDMSYSAAGGGLNVIGTFSGGVEQHLLLRDDHRLEVGQTLRVDLAWGTAPRSDIGLVVAATATPPPLVYDTNLGGLQQQLEDAIFVYVQSNRNDVKTAAINGPVDSGGFAVNLGSTPKSAVSGLYIRRTSDRDFTAGYSLYGGAVDVDFRSWTMDNVNIGNAIGFMGDVRSQTNYGQFDNLSIAATLPPASGSTFTNVIDNTVAAPTGNYLNFADAAVSGDKVAFKTGYNQGFLGVLDSIFTSRGGPRSQIVEELSILPSALSSNDRFSAIDRPAIEGNTVNFGATILSGFNQGDGIFSGSGGFRPEGPVVSTAVSPVFVVASDARISQGVMAFRASTTSAVPDAIYRKASTTTRIIGSGDPSPLGGTFSLIDENYGLSGETIVFRGLYAGGEGIFTKSGASALTVAKKGDATPLGGTFDTLQDPAINGSIVAFLGTYAGGSGIFTNSAGALATVVTTGDTTPSGNAFTGFSSVAVGGNIVAFRGEYAGGGGIYTKTGSVLSKIVEIGDSLFGSTLATFDFSDLGLDPGSSGNVAFTYGLADGRTGVAMYHLGPKPYTIYQRSGEPVLDSVGIVSVPVVILANRNLTNANLPGAELANAFAAEANLTNAYLRSADLTNAILRNANLTGANFEAAQLTGANFSGATVAGTIFTRSLVTTTPVCDSGGCRNFFVVGYGGISPAQLATTASFQAHDLAGIRLDGNILTNAIFVGQNLTGANFTFATLTGARFTGAEIRGASFARYSFSTVVPCANSRPCTLTTGLVGSGIALDQLYSTSSYQAHDLSGISFAGNELAGGNFAEQDLTNANFSGGIGASPAANLANADFREARLHGVNFSGATLTGANLSAADARGAAYANAELTDAVLKNFIHSDGHIAGLSLANGETLLVRDYGDAAVPTTLIPIKVEQNFAVDADGVLRMILDAGAWNSTISFAAGVNVSLGGKLQLLFAEGSNPAAQIGRSIKLFDWTAVAPTGAFSIESPYRWDTSHLYTTGEVKFLAVPEPSAFAIATVILGICLARQRRRARNDCPQGL